jgi:hypothetical protein
MESLKNLIWRAVRAAELAPLVLRVHPRSALLENGWFRSFRENRAVDRQGRIIPWWTYPAIDFLEPRLPRDGRVFEYGCGHSTIWLARRVAEIVSVEHDPEWARRISPLQPAHAKVVLRKLTAGYAEEIDHHGAFDLVVIDGRERLECMRRCLGRLSPRGVILWDDSNQPDFVQGRALAAEQGFRELGFSGMVPAIFVHSCTSILYRPGNCLGI